MPRRNIHADDLAADLLGSLQCRVPVGAVFCAFLSCCPIYLSPATTPTKPIRLHQVWRPAVVVDRDCELPDQGQAQEITEATSVRDYNTPDMDQSRAATRIMLRPNQTQRGHRGTTSDRFDVDLETQPRAGCSTASGSCCGKRRDEHLAVT